MNTYNTEYGVIKGISNYSTFSHSQQLQDICCQEYNELTTSVGILIPRFENIDGRRKNTKCISFYKSGSLKSVDLNTQTSISTSLGSIPAELVTFYETGHLHRIFPRNGQLSGFWSEEDENEINEALSITICGQTFSVKINSLTFYPDGTKKAICFAPGETITLYTANGTFVIRNGISFYPDGSIEALEPAYDTDIHTTIGTLHAFDSTALGIHADHCSLRFDRDGKLQSLLTSSDKIVITDTTGKPKTFQPRYQINPLTMEQIELVPLQISFTADTLSFFHPTVYGETPETFSLKDITQVEINKIPKMNGCSHNCSNCNGCV